MHLTSGLPQLEHDCPQLKMNKLIYQGLQGLE